MALLMARPIPSHTVSPLPPFPRNNGSHNRCLIWPTVISFSGREGILIVMTSAAAAATASAAALLAAAVAAAAAVDFFLCEAAAAGASPTSLFISYLRGGHKADLLLGDVERIVLLSLSRNGSDSF